MRAGDARDGAGQARGAAARVEARRSGPGPGEAAPPRPRLRRVPHRPSRRRRRAPAIPSLPLVPGHQIVGRVEAVGDGAAASRRRARRRPVARVDRAGRAATAAADRRTCATRASSPAITRDGGYAELAVADERFCFPLPDGYADLASRAAAVRRADRLPGAADGGDAERLGLYGFGAAAHIICQVARYQGREVFALHPRRRREAQAFARDARRRRGRATPTSRRPRTLDAAIIFAPVGALVPAALRRVAQGRRRWSAPAST